MEYLDRDDDDDETTEIFKMEDCVRGALDKCDRYGFSERYIHLMKYIRNHLKEGICGETAGNI